MIEYRPFRNSDPPKLVDVWHASQLGRGAAAGFSSDALDCVNLAQPYFDPRGLIVAVEGGDMAGFVHAGFGCNAVESDLSFDTGVICVIMVQPRFRRRGIGRELVLRAESYLRHSGATTILAGPSKGLDPFFYGLYGGSQPSGFLESDISAAPFFEAIGYEPCARHHVFQRDIRDQKDPINFRLSSIRRKMQLEILDHPSSPSWWWMTRLGRLDSLWFRLVPKSGGAAVAGVTVLGLDLYLPGWEERVVGLADMELGESERKQGYGQVLLIETVRRLRQELVTRVETHAADSDPDLIAVLKSSGLSQVDTGVVYRKVAD